MQAVGSVIEIELIIDPIEGECPLRDAVTISSGDGSKELRRRLAIAFQIRKAEHDIGHLVIGIGHPEANDPRSVIGECNPDAICIGQRKQLDAFAVSGIGEGSLVGKVRIVVVL